MVVVVVCRLHAAQSLALRRFKVVVFSCIVNCPTKISVLLYHLSLYQPYLLCVLSTVYIISSQYYNLNINSYGHMEDKIGNP